MPFGCAVPTALNGGAAETRSVALSGDAPSIRGAPSSVDAGVCGVNLSFTDIGEFVDSPSNSYIFYLGPASFDRLLVSGEKPPQGDP